MTTLHRIERQRSAPVCGQRLLLQPRPAADWRACAAALAGVGVLGTGGFGSAPNMVSVQKSHDAMGRGGGAP